MTLKHKGAILDLNWVEARQQCSLRTMFERLKARVESDVDGRMAQDDQFRSRFKFEMNVSNGRFVVIRSEPQNPDMAEYRTVAFKLSNDDIVVLDKNDQELMRAAISLNDEGRCMFVIGTSELESWQMSRRALESLFFQL